MQLINNTKIKGAKISPDSIIECESLKIGKNSVIEENVSIIAKNISIGDSVLIQKNTTIKSLKGVMEKVVIGDQVLIGYSNQIFSPEFTIGDYSQIHNSGLHSGYKPLIIGHNCWIGQSSILNCTEKLEIGNNVRIGTQSQLWTHVASGELLEGCTLIGFKPLVIKDNVWIVGGAVISPGLILEKNSIIMTGAVLTKSTTAFHTYAGVPAKDVTEKINFWKPMEIIEKKDMMKKFVKDFIIENPEYQNSIFFEDNKINLESNDYTGKVIIQESVKGWKVAKQNDISLFDLKTKRYIKNKTIVEIAWIKWCLGYRARFIPYNFID